jgi:cytoskeletal protein CcmA (bactofilin family)
MMGIKHKEEASSGGLHNALAVGSTIKGNVITDADFRLDGRVEGDILCGGKIVVGPKGSVVGNVTSENAEIMGEIDGCVKVNGKLVLKSTARIEGDICLKLIEIEPNARFNGKCIMVCEENL